MRVSARIAVAGISMVLLLAGCSVNIYEAGSGEGGGGGDGGVAEEENTGTVSISGANIGAEADAIQAVIDEYVNPNADFTATYTGSDSFEQNVIIQIEGGTPPDVATFPQPGTVIEQAEQGNAIALEDMGFDIGALEEQYGSYLMSLGEYEGKHYGHPQDVNFKSAIWYNTKAFDAAGYEIPETWDELIALSDQIVADGKNPWCIGTGSEAATGWPATDWMEDIVLRQEGTEVYDGWVDHSVLFDSPEITAAGERFGTILFTPDYVFGGPGNISGTDFRDAPDPMFQDDPPCYLHRQATFITNFFPEGLTPVEDYDFFPFPPIEGNEGALFGGSIAVVFSNRPEVKEFLELYNADDAQCSLGDNEDIALLSANINVGGDCYVNPLLAQAADVLTTALAEDTARFDGSDLMPPAVGSGEFWNGMNNYTNNGPDNLQEVLSAIDAAWPESSGGGDEASSE
jgi:alpha-glucoside transport system substrate-binding protein